MTRGLEYCQIAPILFLWAELALPAAGDIRTCRATATLARVVGGVGAVLAAGLVHRSAAGRLFRGRPAGRRPLAGQNGRVRQTLQLRPADRAGARHAGLEWLRRPQQLRWLVVLVLATPVALSGSYPAVFIVGGVSLALLPTAWRSGWAGRSLFIAYNVFAAATFVMLFASSAACNNAPWLLQYWAEQFRRGHLAAGQMAGVDPFGPTDGVPGRRCEWWQRRHDCAVRVRCVDLVEGRPGPLLTLFLTPIRSEPDCGNDAPLSLWRRSAVSAPGSRRLPHGRHRPRRSPGTLRSSQMLFGCGGIQGKRRAGVLRCGGPCVRCGPSLPRSGNPLAATIGRTRSSAVSSLAISLSLFRTSSVWNRHFDGIWRRNTGAYNGKDGSTGID